MNLHLDFFRVACKPLHHKSNSVSARSRTWSSTFAGSRATGTLRGRSSSTPARSRTWTCSFGGSHDVRFTTRASRSGGWDRTSIDGFRGRRPTVRRPRSDQGGSRTLTPRGHGLLKPVCLPIPPPDQDQRADPFSISEWAAYPSRTQHPCLRSCRCVGWLSE